jgi:hypothetical protein
VTNGPGLSFRIGTPIPGPNHAALLSSYEMLLACAREALPVTVPATEGQLFFESWEITRAALIARMSGTLRHLGYLAPSYSRLDGVALTRTLLDHVITFAWISADPAARLPRFLRSNFNRALNRHREMVERDDELLPDELRLRYERYVEQHCEGTPRLREAASEADDHWLERVRASAPEPMQFPSLAELHRDVYDHFAHLDHPSVAALQMFVHVPQGRPRIEVTGEPLRELTEDLRPYWLGMWSLAWALMVSSLASGRPRLGQLGVTLRQVRALREFDRHGLLVVTEEEGGGVRVDVAPDADARIDEIVKARGDQEDAPGRSGDETP